MAAQTLFHIRVKAYVWRALDDLIEDCGLELHALADGVTVRIDANNANEPDCIVHAGPERPGEDLEIPDPIIVVEVISPTSSSRDEGRKRRDYFSLPSVEHYLIVDPQNRSVLHYDRSNWQGRGRRLKEPDTADLTPPGLALPVHRCFSRS